MKQSMMALELADILIDYLCLEKLLKLRIYSMLNRLVNFFSYFSTDVKPPHIQRIFAQSIYFVAIDLTICMLLFSLFFTYHYLVYGSLNLELPISQPKTVWVC